MIAEEEGLSHYHPRVRKRAAGSVGEPFHDWLFSHVARHYRSSLDHPTLEMSYQSFSSERCFGIDGQWVAEVDVSSLRLLNRERQHVPVWCESLLPVVGILASYLDEPIELPNLVDSEGALYLGGAEVVAVSYEEESWVYALVR